jgi:tRNA U34 5-methylaminomethyl-2-thiouridine-forming methyltransferase MnmC
LADIVYYDAFDPAVQPELWEEDVFWQLIDGLAPGAVLVTYCCKAAVRRAMEAVGFIVEKLPGPSGKREILKARKPA